MRMQSTHRNRQLLCRYKNQLSLAEVCASAQKTDKKIVCARVHPKSVLPCSKHKIDVCICCLDGNSIVHIVITARRRLISTDECVSVDKLDIQLVSAMQKVCVIDNDVI